MPKPRIIRAFSAGGVVFRVMTDIPQAPPLSAPVPMSSEPSPPPGSGSAEQPVLDPLLAGVEVVLVGFLRDSTWTLPKGTPAEGETVEQTAIREVREETGIETIIVGDLGSIHYTFARRGVRFNKEVHHFLMQAIGGDTTLHDAEYDEARWFPIEDAVRRLTYVNEADVVRRAQPLLMARLGHGGE